jgi:hypothetical protein
MSPGAPEVLTMTKNEPTHPRPIVRLAALVAHAGACLLAESGPPQHAQAAAEAAPPTPKHTRKRPSRARST